ncbi:dihydrolipoyl dehydrogenase family protein [Phycisphaera mikurensis]|uniref:Putative glutathione reductase n=1 Tax=Phycisphaera mikurensis (strain NBRC 102666 / KCTC 22515 / FYK2301M01) TaxID=1142394 RepID=I0ICK6_PHYMF|nr:NAD(P)/FAD-dependent oxidoreductase [Phycisphaera mikurensis]MBB6442129.1 glutathione reductase (NADPH) [Phycisphaera mikurensis]BAM02994.1 putative glutathione reductase [Phycisphaera mikurensis NBRC 102666]
MTDVDVAILGCGTAGQMPAYAAAKAGRSVLMIDPHSPGGTCANRGCDAKKPLVAAAEALHRFIAFRGHGLGGTPELRYGELHAFKESFTAPIPAQTRHDLAAAGIRLVEAEAAFVDEQTLEVAGDRFRFGKAAVCTGRVPGTLDTAGGGHAIDSAAFLRLDALPRRVAFVGGGYVGLEFAAVAAVAGSRVTVFEAADRVLAPFDADAVRVVAAGMAAVGVRLSTGRRVTAIEPSQSGFRLCQGDGSPPVEVDLVVATAGRVPAVAGLNLPAAGVEAGERGVRVDRQLRTTNPRIYAGGDVADTGNPSLTPTAARDGRVLRRNLLDADPPRTHLRPDPPRITAAAFTLPTAAMAGYTEAEARGTAGLGEVDAVSGDASAWKLMKQQRAEHAYYKFVYAGSDAARDRRLVGAHLVGPGAEEAINLFATGLHDPAATERLADTAAAYPSFGFNLLNAFRAGL